MEFNRRVLLKFFSAGAIIAPVVNGVISDDLRAKVLESPLIELAEKPKVQAYGSLDFVNRKEVTVGITMDDGTRWTARCMAIPRATESGDIEWSLIPKFNTGRFIKG